MWGEVRGGQRRRVWIDGGVGIDFVSLRSDKVLGGMGRERSGAAVYHFICRRGGEETEGWGLLSCYVYSTVERSRHGVSRVLHHMYRLTLGRSSWRLIPIYHESQVKPASLRRHSALLSYYLESNSR